MDLVHRLHYLVLSQKSDLMTMEREQRMRMRRQSSLPEYSKAHKTRQRLEQAYFNDVSKFATLNTFKYYFKPTLYCINLDYGSVLRLSFVFLFFLYLRGNKYFWLLYMTKAAQLVTFHPWKYCKIMCPKYRID